MKNQCIITAPGTLCKKLYYLCKLFQLFRNKHTNLLGPFVSYKENKVL
jgi:hypothetical protein